FKELNRVRNFASNILLEHIISFAYVKSVSLIKFQSLNLFFLFKFDNFHQEVSYNF
mgnify:CR=1